MDVSFSVTYVLFNYQTLPVIHRNKCYIRLTGI